MSYIVRHEDCNTHDQAGQRLGQASHEATRFWRNSGALDNGANFSHRDHDWIYSFTPGMGSLHDKYSFTNITGSLELGPGELAGHVEIISFKNGLLTWTSDVEHAVVHIEWAPDLASGFTSGWSRQSHISGTSYVMQIEVPMFYRVVSP